MCCTELEREEAERVGGDEVERRGGSVERGIIVKEVGRRKDTVFSKGCAAEWQKRKWAPDKAVVRTTRSAHAKLRYTDEVVQPQTEESEREREVCAVRETAVGGARGLSAASAHQRAGRAGPPRSRRR